MIKIEIKGELVVFNVAGNLDVLQAEELEKNLNSQIKNDKKYFVIDLWNINYMSSSGLRVFIATKRLLGPLKGRLLLSNPSSAVISTLELLQMKELFEIVNSTEEALKMLQK
jgi:anti-anti-sigma factor